ncbi:MULTISPECIES: restriction endonuclease [unclassified Sedimentibacter]|uniref:restriction endonuclease n=1 Tax=unclassified Sedimentibacter TaxID=2649220 RepID=UPI0027E03C1D|nr:restriction endonuclease [Sedimentibacter sp. MB35-C1]WMJ76403.1 hypothetical protein RBQ61_12295 [Sedimentibacter sp. MB35-C1]
MEEKNKIKKGYISEAIGTRNYFSYRADLVLYKVLLSMIVLLVIFFITSDLKFSILIAAEVFLIFTLVNKLNITRKRREGEEKLIYRLKTEHFRKKIEEINNDDFGMLIGFLFEKKGCRNFIKKGRHMFLAEKDGLINCIKIYKLYQGTELEKTDVRSMISFMCSSSIKIGYLVTTVEINEEAKKLLEKFEDKLHIEIIDSNALFNMMDEAGILPGKEYFSKKIYEEKSFVKKKSKLKNNVFDNKKIIVYVFAAVFFYITSAAMPNNTISIYISYYFILLTVVSGLYMIWVKYISKETGN